MAHKTTIQYIEKISKDFPNGQYFKVKVNPQTTGGFWSIEIDCSERTHVIKEIEHFSRFVGHMFGENVCMDVKNNILKIW